LNAEVQGQNLVTTIQDGGIGISPEDLPHIFDGFFRGKSGQAGHGIGLAVAHQIVDAHNGSINVTSELGKGTTFMVSLPIFAKE
jgi:two-component system sensor histidine kinase ResE